MKNKLSLVLMFLLGGFLTTSCASIINGRTQTVSISTNPPGAVVTNGKTQWTTPAVVELKRKDPQLLTITKPGFRPQTVKLERAFSGAVCGNIILGGVIGWGVDALTGAQWRLIPENVAVDLIPLQPGEKALYDTAAQTPAPAAAPVAVNK